MKQDFVELGVEIGMMVDFFIGLVFSIVFRKRLAALDSISLFGHYPLQHSFTG